MTTLPTAVDNQISLKERIQLIFYIHDNVDVLTRNNRIEIGKMMIHNVTNLKIKEKGSGSQFYYENFPNKVLILITNFIRSNIDKGSDIL